MTRAFKSLYAIKVDHKVVARRLFSEEQRQDKNFEIVYCAIETYVDGYERCVVCYRLSTPGWSPKQQGVPATGTFQMFIEADEWKKI